nr:E3 ubiquitin-protein ligase siah-1-like [Leptinotarsa decemlineata]
MRKTLIQMLMREVDCFMCDVQLNPPITQCASGHHYCAKCTSSLTECSKCQLPLGTRRAYFLEKLCFRIVLKCSFTTTGCCFIGLCGVVAQHERKCPFRQKFVWAGVSNNSTSLETAFEQDSTGADEISCPIQGSSGQLLDEVILAELECSICCFRISPPIMECVNGHRICNSCLEQVGRCPTCRAPKPSFLNFCLQYLFSVLTFPCMYGCGKRDFGHYLARHEKSCSFTLTTCPLMEVGLCKWQGIQKEFKNHFRTVHSGKFKENTKHQ